ncbi:MAG: inositol monophosphatase family protein, partial [bacterium]|nr:inositol monophosphatase family protein [bacterium]
MDKLLKTAIKAAKNAEKIILNYYSEEIKFKLKEDQTPVTLADIESERIIIKTIKSQFPTHSFLGEEATEKEVKSDYLWIIDPIDGTKNYTRKIPFFGTQIALMHQGELIIGVSNAPALKELMFAQKGKGTFLNEEKVFVSKINKLSESAASFGNLHGFESSGLIKNFLSFTNFVRHERGFGDFWSYHLVAQGKIDTMVEVGCRIWDIAAIKVIVEEAGGKVT